MESTPVEPGSESTTPSSSTSGSSGLPPTFSSASSAAWTSFAEKMFPGDPNAAADGEALQRNMLTMINTTIQEINTRNQAASDYAKQVAEGNE
jgi:hypothetical protein